MKRLWKRVVKVTRPMIFVLVSLISLGLLYSFRLGSNTPGYSSSEIKLLDSSSSIDSIVSNPINAPYKLAVWGVNLVSNDIFALRLVSVLASLIVIVLFYLIAKKFFDQFYATLGTLLFASSSIMLNTGRLINANIMLLTLFVLIACGYALRFQKSKATAWILTGAAVGLAVYVPGMIFFIIAGSIWQFKRIKRSLANVRPALLITCFVIFAALMAPIVYGIVLQPSLLKEFFGLPQQFPKPLESLKAFLSVPAGVLLIAPENPVYRLGKQPILDMFSFGMLLLGCYAFVRKLSLDRTKLLIGIGAISMIWVGISANYEHAFVLVPFIFMLVTAGLFWFGNEWRKVFPNNPLAGGVATIFLLVGVFFSSTFQLRRYFVAWPHNETVKAAFQESKK